LTAALLVVGIARSGLRNIHGAALLPALALALVTVRARRARPEVREA
jgi:hypothetical protein